MPEDARARRRRDGLLLGLTFCSGMIDALSYLGLGQIFTANMTGNTVLFAISVGQRDLLTIFRRGDALLGFALGAFLAGGYLERVAPSPSWLPQMTRVLLVELSLVIVFAITWFALAGTPGPITVYPLIAVSSIGMGMQSAVGRKAAVPGVTTNVVTLAMTGLMAELAATGISGSNVRRWTLAIVTLGAGAALGGLLFVAARPLLPIAVAAVLAGTCVVALRGERTSGGDPSVA